MSETLETICDRCSAEIEMVESNVCEVCGWGTLCNDCYAEHRPDCEPDDQEGAE